MKKETTALSPGRASYSPRPVRLRVLEKWKFPYILGANGGEIFLAAGLIICDIAAVFVCLFESAIGKHTVPALRPLTLKQLQKREPARNRRL